MSFFGLGFLFYTYIPLGSCVILFASNLVLRNLKILKF